MKRQVSKREREIKWLVKCIFIVIIIGVCVYLSNGKEPKKYSYNESYSGVSQAVGHAQMNDWR